MKCDLTGLDRAEYRISRMLPAAALGAYVDRLNVRELSPRSYWAESGKGLIEDIDDENFGRLLLHVWTHTEPISQKGGYGEVQIHPAPHCRRPASTARKTLFKLRETEAGTLRDRGALILPIQA